ncbi:hypothetical protein B484DRAFT_428774 [Ochromonadaceae sp. CCMP2298]|nr:hypothetical protein B484DRAFT_428774 [Ochromonadaceae sp. CCMP2298]
MDSLAGYLQSEDSRSLLGRQHILASLTDVLSRLGPEVQKNLSVGVEFNPEVTQADKVELRGLLETRAQLQQHSEKLSAYLADVSVLAADHDLWLGAKVEDTLKKRREDSSESSAALETAQQYLQILENLDAHCAQVLSSTERTREAVALGTKASDRLFKAFKKARDEGLSSKAPKDTKELLRKLPNLF